MFVYVHICTPTPPHTCVLFCRLSESPGSNDTHNDRIVRLHRLRERGREGERVGGWGERESARESESESESGRAREKERERTLLALCRSLLALCRSLLIVH